MVLTSWLRSLTTGFQRVGGRNRRRLSCKNHARRTKLDVEALEPRLTPVNIGYYDMFSGEGIARQVAPILAAGHTPVKLLDLSAAELAGVQVINVENPFNDTYGAEYLSRLPEIQNAVAAGKALVIHDRFVDGAETILPGGAGFNILRDLGSNIDVQDDTTLVTRGPGGVINNTTLDGFNFSDHGFAVSSSLPAAAKRILSTGDPTHLVTFSYAFGAGTVVYSSIPLDFFLEFGGNVFSNIYAPNVLAYSVSAIANQAPVANAGGPYVVAEGTAVTLDGSRSTDDSGIVSYAWDLNYDGVTFDADLVTASPTISRTFADDFSGTIALRVTDANGASNIATASLTVLNVAAAVGAIAGPANGVPGQAVSYSAAFTDAGTADTHSARFDWGDGSTSPAAVSETSGAGSAGGNHVYLAPGIYTITLTVTDDNGGVTVVSKQVTVTSVALQTDACDPAKTQLAVGGTAGNDLIILSPGGATGTVRVTLNFTSLGTFDPSGRLVVYAQAGHDLVLVNGLGKSAWLYGQAGNDLMKGSAGNDVLLGGEGSDLLAGGTGRDLLIGGLGGDWLIGFADDDILIAGWTDHDASEPALCRLMDEWTRLDADFLTRVSHVRGPQGGGSAGGRNGTFFLNSQTVHDDGVMDVLTGGAGIDWFLFNPEGAARDIVTDLTTFEQMFGQDIDFITEP